MSADSFELTSPSPVTWVDRAQSILASDDASRLIMERRSIASVHGLAAIFFDTTDIKQQVGLFAAHEVRTGRANRAKYVNMLNGGTPFHADMIEAIKTESSIDALTDRLRVSAYDGPLYVGAHVVRGPEFDPETLEESDEAVLLDDGVDTGGSVGVGAEELNSRYGILDIALITALTKQPNLVIPGVADNRFMFTTPFGPWGEGYGFDSDGHNSQLRLIGLSMTQPEDAFETVEHTINTLGGADGIALASIDQIVRFNRK